jgi:hypothetical protein
VELPEDCHSERYCLLTTEARVTARRHTAELWFVPAPGGVHLMSGSGGLTSWCLNLQAEERGVLRIGTRGWQVRAAFLAPDDPDRDAVLARFHERYDPPGKDRLAAWRRDAVVVHLVLVREA